MIPGFFNFIQHTVVDTRNNMSVGMESLSDTSIYFGTRLFDFFINILLFFQLF